MKMQESKSLYRIYSRNRINIFKKNPNSGKYNKKKIRIVYFWVIIVIAVIVYEIIYKGVEPTFEVLCSESAHEIATKVTNEQSTKVMTKYKYNDIFSIEKDESRKYSNDKC